MGSGSGSSGWVSSAVQYSSGYATGELSRLRPPICGAMTEAGGVRLTRGKRERERPGRSIAQLP